MRTSFVTVTGVLAISLLAGCTVKDVEPPSLAGPSTLARAITMTANKDTLFQNGVDFVDILVTSAGPTGQQQTVPLRAEIQVGGVAQDFGTLSTKSPITPTTIRYTAPNASSLTAGQVAQIVTIAVTPIDSGDFRSEVARQLDLRLVPQGVILPTNPNLVAKFTVTPTSPQAFATASSTPRPRPITASPAQPPVAMPGISATARPGRASRRHTPTEPEVTSR